MRAFIAIELEPELKEYLGEIQAETQQYCRRGQYTPINNLHITLHFLGEVDGGDVDYLREAVFEAAQRNRAFSLTLGQIGFFPKGERGVLWTGIEKSPELQRLFLNLSKSLQRQGFGRDKTGLTPHITMGREVEPQRGFADVQKAVAVEPRKFLVEKITLMESVRRGPELFYRPLFRQPLKEK